MIVGVAVTFVYAIDSFANGTSSTSLYYTGPTRTSRTSLIAIDADGYICIRSNAEYLVVLIYPASEAPKYIVGYKAAAAFCVACLICTGIFKYKDRTLREALERQDEFRQQSQREELDQGVLGPSRGVDGQESGDGEGKRI